MPPINQQEGAGPEKLFLLFLTIGELLACTEASTKLYAHTVKEYIRTKEARGEDQPATKEKLRLIANAKSGMEKFQSIIESVEISAIARYRGLEIINPLPPEK